MAPHILFNLTLPTSWSVYMYFLPFAKTILAELLHYLLIIFLMYV